MNKETLQRISLYAPLVGGLSVLAWTYIRRSAKNPSRLPYPPGPKPLPLIGNLLDLPTGEVWKTYDAWAKLYGDVIYTEALGTSVVILNSAKAVNDLMERRGGNYSDRPRCVWVNELAGFAFAFSIAPYGGDWRMKRRAFHRYLHQGIAVEQRPVQLKQTRKYLQRLLRNPDEFLVENHHLLGEIIMKVVYGYDCDARTDKTIKTADQAIRNISEGLIPGRYLVDIIPALKWVPSWFPGAQFQRKAKETDHLLQQTINGPFERVKATMASGHATPCMVTDMIENGDSDQVAKDCSALAYVVGADTTESALATFFLAMVNHPEYQARAQAELDAVLGHGRLPEYVDREHLPYLRAIISEVLRWIPVTPLAIPHATIEDDEYNGYFIPKGSIIVGNAWGILHDPEEYPSPESFNPERFLTKLPDGTWGYNTIVRDPTVACFGFGRRMCPGRHLSEQSIWAVASHVLATCSLTPPLDAEGKPVYPKVEMTAGSALSFPAPFKCVIKPRHEYVEQLIAQAVSDGMH